eukprot:682035-Alexandrium_andersonii.AAC.1
MLRRNKPGAQRGLGTFGLGLLGRVGYLYPSSPRTGALDVQSGCPTAGSAKSQGPPPPRNLAT